MGDEHLITNTRRTGEENAVLCFADDMLKKLKANSHNELETAADKSADKIIGECADVANFAMMIADNVRSGK